MAFLDSPLAGCMILLIAVVILCLYAAGKSKREHAAAMQKYEEGMAAYRAALEGNSGLKPGAPFTPPDLSMEARSDAVAPYFGPMSSQLAGMVKTAGGSSQVELSGVDERTAAMVIAILCEQLGGDPSRLWFHSIKAV